ncbi:MAG: hypothetical protein ACRBDL_08260 [Alphaproteobacteria bacterium]
MYTENKMHNGGLMVFQVLQQRIDSLKSSSSIFLRSPIMSVCVGLAVFSCSLGTAWSYDTLYNHDVSRETSNSLLSPSSAVADLCIPLLKSNLNSPQSATDRNQRSVGKITALGMILGARFALEPKSQVNEDSVSYETRILKHIANDRKPQRSAQAIAAYRQCQKEQVLVQLVLR